MPKLVAVTGATGFIGSVLIQRLIHTGWTVRALARTVHSPNTEKVQWIRGDLSSVSALHQLVEDATHVVHCAATVRGNSFQDFAQTNIAGTENLLSAIEQQRSHPRFLLVSSLAARQPELSWYARSKYLSEKEVIDRSNSLQWIILRPTAVYGPGDKELKPLFKAMHQGLLPVVGKIDNRFGLIHVFDLVSAIEAWLTTEKAINNVFELDDGTSGGYSYRDLISLAQHAWNRTIRCVTIPDMLIRSIAYSNLWLSHLLHYSPMLTPGKVNELQHSNWVCDNSPLIHALPSWQPRIRLQDVLSEVI